MEREKTTEEIIREFQKKFGVIDEGETSQMDIEKDMSLEERYTEAMKLAGYERITDHPAAEEGFLAFRNEMSGNTTVIDGWQGVGQELEEKAPLSEADRARFEELIHPQGRIEYYTQNLTGEGDMERVMYKNFQEAFAAYQDAGYADGKTLGYMFDGKNATALTWVNEVYCENILSRVAAIQSSPRTAERMLPEAGAGELAEFRNNVAHIAETLERENVCLQADNAVNNMEGRLAHDLQRGDWRPDNWEIRIANNSRPQDYIRAKVYGSLYEQDAAVKLQAVHANEIVSEYEKTVPVSEIRDKGYRVFDFEEQEKWIQNEVQHMDCDFHTTMGERVFTTYSGCVGETYSAMTGLCELDTHCEKLELGGYDRNPVYAVSASETARDITAKGFKPTESLVSNIAKFERLEGRHYSMRDLAALKHSNPDFKGHPEKKACFEKIVKECQEQEGGRMQSAENAAEKDAQESFLKKQMMLEMEQTLTAGM